MQENMTAVAEPEVYTHGVAMRKATYRCESTMKRCSKLGEGWVVDVRRPPRSSASPTCARNMRSSASRDTSNSA